MKKTKKFIIAGLLLSLGMGIFAQEQEQIQDKLPKIESEVLSEAANAFLKKATDGLAKGLNKAGEELQNHTVIWVTGRLEVKGKQGNRNFILKVQDGNRYKLKTVTGSETSIETLNLYKGKLISVKGVVNKETEEMTVLSYSLQVEKE